MGLAINVADAPNGILRPRSSETESLGHQLMVEPYLYLARSGISSPMLNRIPQVALFVSYIFCFTLFKDRLGRRQSSDRQPAG